MHRSIRKAFIAVAALTAIVLVPVSAASSDLAGGYGEWPCVRSASR